MNSRRRCLPRGCEPRSGNGAAVDAGEGGRIELQRGDETLLPGNAVAVDTAGASKAIEPGRGGFLLDFFEAVGAGKGGAKEGEAGLAEEDDAPLGAERDEAVTGAVGREPEAAAMADGKVRVVAGLLLTGGGRGGKDALPRRERRRLPLFSSVLHLPLFHHRERERERRGKKLELNQGLLFRL